MRDLAIRTFGSSFFSEDDFDVSVPSVRVANAGTLCCVVALSLPGSTTVAQLWRCPGTFERPRPLLRLTEVVSRLQFPFVPRDRACRRDLFWACGLRRFSVVPDPALCLRLPRLVSVPHRAAARRRSFITAETSFEDVTCGASALVHAWRLLTRVRCIFLCPKSDS